ncbi:hypothetical protein LEN26_015388 [Aphanomyces euteiches]|nr:hypothetical protein LEN26_015388 [Aphanomyces euteiches]KAH9115777.1 hypothetical protein AeMF1_010222 [Aphanomyces euteiches]KAH9197056.1 hypothetical protein AeNC1_000954 [Aphanomyces euteiches]
MLEVWFREEGWRASTGPYLEGTLIFVSVMHVFETYLDYRQHQKLHDKTFPEKLRQAIERVDEQNQAKATKKDGENKTKDESAKSLLAQTMDKFEKSRLYGLDKSRYSFVHGNFFLVEGLAMLLLGYMPFMWQCSRHLVDYFGYDRDHEILVSLAFLTLTSVKDMLLSLPFELYSTFVVEERHGFNKQTLRLFVTDKIKSTVLMMVFGYLLLAALIAIIRWGGDNFVFYVWAFTFAFTLIMMTIYPVWIMPLFNKFTPLEDGPLRTAIEALAASLRFPLTKLFVCDGSKRSGHSNAYLFGFFNSKRIVLYDTLLEQATQEEIVAILGHELGHWKLWHTIQGFVIQQVYIVAMFTVFGWCMHDRNLFASFGFQTDVGALPIMIGLTLFSTTLWAPVDKVLSFLLTANTRAKEFQADAFAVDLGHGEPLQSGLTKISLENLSNMNPDKLYSAYHYSHPPLLERLAAITTRMVKLNKSQ